MHIHLTRCLRAWSRRKGLWLEQLCICRLRMLKISKNLRTSFMYGPQDRRHHLSCTQGHHLLDDDASRPRARSLWLSSRYRLQGHDELWEDVEGRSPSHDAPRKRLTREIHRLTSEIHRMSREDATPTRASSSKS